MASAAQLNRVDDLTARAERLLLDGEAVDPHAYALRPVEYAVEVLGITTLTDVQKTILLSLHEQPCRTLVPSAHSVGKTFVAALALNYWYDSFPESVVISTAPTQRDVVDLLWTEVRLQRQRAIVPLCMDFIGPRAPEMRTADNHYAKGFTAVKGESFQGRHRKRMLFIFDEANGVDPMYWTTTKTMFDPGLDHAWLAIFNPTETTSQAYQEHLNCDESDGNARWRVIPISALDHPNVKAELPGGDGIRKQPGAVTKAMVDEWVQEWCEPLHPGEERRVSDLQWPPDSGRWFRAGPIFQARALGLWPDSGSGVWSPALFDSCFPAVDPPFPTDRLPQIGCDCAQGKSLDFHAIHARWGAVSFHHETANTMDAVRILERLRDACRIASNLVNSQRDRMAARVRAQDMKIIIDDDGTGNAVSALLKREGYTVILVSAASVSRKPDLYPRMRDEAWFNTADRARIGFVCLNRLDRKTRARLRQQLLAPEWDVDAAGRRVVEKKDDTKEKIGRSPDDADAFNLAYLEYNSPQAEKPPEAYRPPERRVR